MSFNIEIAPRKDTKGADVHAVIVNIDGHETVVSFMSKEDAENFAQVEQARLSKSEQDTLQRVREIAYRLWQDEGCPQGEALRHWFAAQAILESEQGGGDGASEAPSAGAFSPAR